MPQFNEFDLDQKILNTLAQLGYKTPTPIQELAIPKALEGCDLLASAQTGTGKTAAFMLPSLHKMMRNPRQKGKGPRMLILVPTRELAMQIAKVAEKYSRSLDHIRTICIYGGVPYPIQRRQLSRPYEILVATPGRLIDHMDQGIIDLSNLEIFVLDEADRMLDMGFIEPVEQIAASSPADRQTLLFSATFDKKIIRLSKALQKDPQEIRIEPENLTRKNIQQKVYYTDSLGHKMQLIDHILEHENVYQAILFTSTISSVDTIADELSEKGHKVGGLHGDMNQRQRSRMIKQLREGKIQLLVATDVAARGIDIDTVTHVINIDLPFQAEDYVHRIGRTGRADNEGVAISFASQRERDKLEKIHKLIGFAIEVHTAQGLEPKQKKSSPSKHRDGKPDWKRDGKTDWKRDGKKKSFHSNKPSKPNQPNKNGAFTRRAPRGGLKGQGR